MSNPQDPRILALVDQGVTAATVIAACDAARQAKPSENIGVGYVVAILQRWAKEAVTINAQGARAPAAAHQQTRDEQNRLANEEAKRMVFAAYRNPNDPEVNDASE
jgi:hypothetical protein